jgi:outer membrane protein OmpA-like peptidoglycan-associated protein
MAQIMKQQPKAVFKLEGHTDSIGSKEFNNRLSESRAISVRNYFIKDLSVPENSIQIEYFGESKPKASNSTKEGRTKNRRVEIIRIK